MVEKEGKTATGMEKDMDMEVVETYMVETTDMATMEMSHW